MNKRVRAVRETKGLSRAAFGEKLGVSGDVINNLERGRVDMKDSMMKLICSIYSVDERWLRTGEGEMFRQDGESVVDRLCEELHADKLETEIIHAYFKIDEKIRLPFLRQLIQEVKDFPAEVADSKMETTTPERTELDIMSELAETKTANVRKDRSLTIEEQVEIYRQQLILEEERAEQASFVKESDAG